MNRRRVAGQVMSAFDASILHMSRNAQTLPVRHDQLERIIKTAIRLAREPHNIGRAQVLRAARSRGQVVDGPDRLHSATRQR